jgi:LacI family transcriptional regulator
MATIKDVARESGVSTATVSHVINNTRFVEPQTRDHVLEVIERLNYRPNALARSLTTNTTNLIGVLVADITNPFFAFMISGIEDLLAAQNYNLVVCNTGENPQREVKALELLHSKRVDGIIILPTGVSHSIFEDLVKEEIPLIFLERQLPQPYGPLIKVDVAEAASKATEYLIQLNHRSIGLIVRQPTLSSVRNRIDGYRQALQAHNIPFREELIQVTDLNVEAASRAAHRLLELPGPPTAIISGQLTTLGVFQALRENHLECPRDLSVISFDDSVWAPIFNPPLTVVRQPIPEICQEAVKTLLEIIVSKEKRKRNPEKATMLLPKDILLKAELVIRESCAPLKMTPAT